MAGPTQQAMNDLVAAETSLQDAADDYAAALAVFHAALATVEQAVRDNNNTPASALIDSTEYIAYVDELDFFHFQQAQRVT